MTDRWQVLLIGEGDREEFSSASLWISERARVVSVGDFSQAIETCQAGTIGNATDASMTPDLVVAFQGRPGEWAAADWESLQKRAPLARMVALVGSQCEGEPRSGKPWPGLTRIYWYDWQARLEREFLATSPRRWQDWELPRTAADVDASLHRAQQSKSWESKRRAWSEEARPVVAICASHFSTCEGLIEACELFGYQAIDFKEQASADQPFEFDTQTCQGKFRDFDLLIWDGDSLDDPEWSNLADVCRRAAPAKVVALLGFPRLQDHRRATAAGAAVVIAKPFQLEDLCWHLDALMEPKTLLRRLA